MFFLPATLQLSHTRAHFAHPRVLAPPTTPHHTHHTTPHNTTQQFHVRYKCEFGQEVYLVGSCAALGDWDVLRGKQLVWSPGHIWEGSVELPAG